MLRLNEVASQSETFSKRVLETASQTVDCMGGPSGPYRGVFSIDRPPLLAVMRHQCGNRQNSEVSPSSANSASASSIVRRLQSGSRRSGLYQACAKRQHLSRGIISPRGRFQSLHHFSMCSSDQKSSIVFQLKTMSSHQ